MHKPSLNAINFRQALKDATMRATHCSSARPLAQRRRTCRQLQGTFERLEPRNLLAVDGWTINLNGGGGTGLLGSTSGGTVQSNFAQTPGGGALNTTNRPGINNHPPVAVADSFVITEKTWLAGNVLTANPPASIGLSASGAIADYDPDGDPLSITGLAGQIGNLGTVVHLASGAAALIQSDGSFIYWPNNAFYYLNAGQMASDQFVYRLADGRGGATSGTVNIAVNGVNDTPRAFADSVAVTADMAAINIAPMILANDTDPDAGQSAGLRVVGLTGYSGLGTLEMVAGQVIFSPNGQYQWLTHGQTITESFSYEVIDTLGARSGLQLSTLVIAGVNDQPIALNDARTISEDAIGIELTSWVLSNDSDVDQGESTELRIVALDTRATQGEVSLAGNRLLYTSGAAFQSLSAHQTALDTFVYTIVDPYGALATATVSLTIQGVNDAPLAVNDQLIINEKAADSLISDALLANDTDIDDGESELLEIIAIDSSVARGRLLMEGSQVRYSPNDAFDYLAEGQTATDLFTYTVRDVHGTTSSATATIVITGVNDPAVAIDDTLTGLDEDSESTDITAAVLGNDFDPDEGETAALQIVAVDSSSSIGSATLVNGVLSYWTNGQFDYLASGDVATDTLTYTVRDLHGATVTAQVTLHISGVDDLASSITLDVILLPPALPADSFIGLLDTDDPDTFDYVYSLVSGDGDVDNHLFRIVGNSLLADSYLGAGPWTVRVRAEAGSGSSVEQVLTIAVNTAPTLWLDSANSSNTWQTEFIEGHPAAAVTSGPVIIDVNDDQVVLANISLSDLDAGLESLSVTLAHGITLDPSSNATALRLRGAATPAQYAEVLASITYFHSGNQPTAGQRVVSFEISDGIAAPTFAWTTITLIPVDNGPELDLDGDDSSGGTQGDFATRWRETTQFNMGSGPVALADSDLVIRDQDGMGTTLLSMTVILLNAGVDDRIVFPTLPESLSLTSTIIDSQPAWVVSGLAEHAIYAQVIGAITFDIGGQVLWSDTRGVVFILDDGDEPSDPVTASITIEPANDPAVIDLDADDSAGQTGNNYAVTFVEAGLSTAGTGPVFVADADVTVTDREGDDFLDELRVTLLDSASTLHEVLAFDSSGLSGAFASDWDGTTLTITGTNSLSQWSAAIQRITYHNSADRIESLVRTIRMIAVQDAVAGPASFTFVSIQSSHDGIVAVADAISVDEDDVDIALTSHLLSNDWSPDTENNLGLTITAVDDSNSVGQLSLNNGLLLYSAAGRFDHLSRQQSATDTFVYTISDILGAMATATVTITVHGQNDHPVAVDDLLVAITEDDVPLILNNDLLANDSDIDADEANSLAIYSVTPISILGELQMVAGSVTYNPAGRFEYLGQGQSAIEVFTYQIWDIHAAISLNTATATIVIQGVNDQPTNLELSANRVLRNEAAGLLVGSLSVSDPDVGDAHTYQLVSGAGDDHNHLFTISEDQLRTADVITTNGVVTIRVQVDDGQGGQLETIFSIWLDDRPTIDPGHTASQFVEATANDPGSGPVAVGGGVITLTANADLRGAIVTLTPVDPQEESLSIDGQLPDGITLEPESTAWQLRFSGQASVADYEQVLSTIRFDHSSDRPTSGIRVITLQVSDERYSSREVTIGIDVIEQNDAPVAGDYHFHFDQDSPATVLSAELLAAGFDPDDDTFEIVAFDAWLGAGLISLLDGQLQFDPQGQYSALAAGEAIDQLLTYTIRDGRFAESTATITLTIAGRNDAPMDLVLSSGTLNSSDPIGTMIGSFTATDLDHNAVPRYELVSGQGDDDNHYFSIIHTEGVYTLTIYEPLPAQLEFTIRIRVEDEHGAATERVLVLIDDNPVQE